MNETTDLQSHTADSRRMEFWKWKSPYQLCFICLLPFVFVLTGCLLLGLVWAKAVPTSTREAVLTLGMVFFFSGFIGCVIANFFDACGAFGSRSETEQDTHNNETLFVDLGDLGPTHRDSDDEGEKSDCENTVVECVSV